MSKDRVVGALLLILAAIWAPLAASALAVLIVEPESYSACGGGQAGFLGTLLMAGTAVACVVGAARLFMKGR